MRNVEYDSESESYHGHDSDGSTVTFSPDSDGDYRRTTTSSGYDVIENSNGETVAYVHTYD